MLVSTPDFVAPADDDPNAGGLATHSSPGGPIGEVVVRAQAATCIALERQCPGGCDCVGSRFSADAPIRPTDLDAGRQGEPAIIDLFACAIAAARTPATAS